MARARSLGKAALIVALLLAALIAGREGALLTHATAHAATAPTSPSTVAAHHTSPSVRGDIAAVGADQWTVTTSGGASVTVTLTAQTQFGATGNPADRAQFSVGATVAVTGARSGGTVVADRVTITQSNPSTPAPSASTVLKAPPSTPAPTTCAVSPGLTQALAEARSRGEQAAIAVYDTTTGAYTAAGDADAEYSAASVTKVLIATDLLLTNQMSGDTADTAYQMITASDDDAADALYGLVGGDAVITTVANHYGISNLGSPPVDTGQWGETKVTADGLAHLYAKLKADPTVWPWLSNTMANTTRDGTDGTDQFFGIPSASQDWAVKQGWMTGLGPGSTYDSTGYVDANRYVVVILTYGSVDQYGQYMSDTITALAKDALPHGVPAMTSVPCPS
ncbi:MAG: serine hydrolase [Mycobacteriaceae bacterium]